MIPRLTIYPTLLGLDLRPAPAKVPADERLELRWGYYELYDGPTNRRLGILVYQSDLRRWLRRQPVGSWYWAVRWAPGFAIGQLQPEYRQTVSRGQIGVIFGDRVPLQPRESP